MRELFRIRDYRLLWTGQAVSNFGDAITNLALLLTAQRLTGSVAAVATTAIAVALPTLLFGLVAGAYVDRWNRKRVMIVSDLFRSGFVLLFLLVTTADLMWLLYVVAFIQASLGTFFTPAKSAYLPRIVGTDQLLAANSVSQMTQIVAGLAGTAAAGIVAASFETLSAAFITDAASFLVSLAAIAAIRTSADPERTEAVESIWADVRTGLAVATHSRVLIGVMLGGGIAMLGIGAVNVLLVPFVVDTLGVSETWFAALEGSQVVSMVAAASLVAVLAKKIKPTAIISWALAGVGAVAASISLVTAPWHLMIALFVVGWFMTPLHASISTLVQTEVSDELRGRTSSALSTVITAANVTSMALAGVAATLVGIRSVFVLAGIISVLAGIATAVLFRGVQLAEPAESAA